MQIAQLPAEKREAQGTRASRRLRKDGKLPAIIYGHGQTPENITIPVRELNMVLEHGAHLVELKVNGAAQQCLIKDVQYDHLGIVPVHADFARVDLNERVKVRVPLDFRGTPVGVNEGGLLDHDMVDIEIECLVTEIPDSLRVNVAELKLGQNLHVRELELPANVKAISPPEAIVASVRAKTAEVVATAPTEEGPTQPEIIGRKEKVEEGEEGEDKDKK
jgi:large subunit ribosomal protein L25